ncbi:helix-turn-helix transcriptional regulator [Pseudoflavitalea sp. G-6-1-2]|uniref:winged helix-turn-helix transcriptional regulator n=1 Tax=Pseudoflavitalea sp. G-6-1-2 TaxID=2728841 RepID=UPI00146E7601|nr:helix-turn-helix domain-containing protein [Pseudoflavitalea sp. G-6-1-2]NML21413.1 helix-turn-helix transcriptional regulator [Pseudoflavitalea sp. G-6-1-2]
MEQEVTKRLPARKRTSIVLNEQCSVIATLKLFATKWKPCILCYLSEGPLRYNDLYRIIPNISRKILSEHLRELERDEVITRTQYDPKRQKVDYALTEKGRSLLPLLNQLQDWGMLHLNNVLTIRQMLDATLN